MDLNAIATAIATTVGTVAATSGSETETLTATADLPDAVGKRALLVTLPSADLGMTMGPHIDDHYLFSVVMLRDPLKVAPRVRWLLAWATALRGRIATNIDLDVPGVVEARATALRIELGNDRGGYPYVSAGGGTINFDVVEMTVDVHVIELIAASI
jgi:hypothetical protein